MYVESSQELVRRIENTRKKCKNLITVNEEKRL
jgi:hypothetical protein